ncbi:MAG TPA: hydroxyacid dehydrogenase [Pseudolabrys sp.]|nr:hydroxyacid dehydrogenase [Pseudolabrys sp.]
MAAIVITEFMDEEAIRGLLGSHEVVYDPALVDRREDLLAAVARADALIVRNRTRVDAALLDRAPKLQAVGRLGVGLDNIDMDACRARGITVYPATGANDAAVVEWVIAVMLVLLRGAYAATGDVIAGAWPRTKLMGREAGGKRLGLVGFGAIGRKVGAVAAALGMDVAAFDPHLPASDAAWRQPWGNVTPCDLKTLLGGSDVISLHVPLTGATRNMIDAEAIAGMKRGAILINAARGGVVEEAAVAAALKSGALGGAALDVFAQEPLTADGGAVFAGCPNLILTPHIAGVTVEANTRVSRLVAEKIRDHLAGGA